MNKKILIIMVSLFLALLGLTSCKENTSTYMVKERIVQTKIIKTTSLPETISYLGFIEPFEIKTYSLKTGGIVETVAVKSGDFINDGDLLLALDSYEYDLNVQASSEQLKLAQLDLSKAVEARDFYKKMYNDTLTLFNSGIVSSQKFDEIKLQYDIKQKEVEQAVKKRNQAALDTDYKNTTLSDTALFSDMKGYVVEVISKEGELVGQGYPVVIVRSESNIVQIGMVQDDVKRVQLGDDARVVTGEDTYIGTITNLNLMPDKITKTYLVEIVIEQSDFLIGESCRVYIDLAVVEGIWINITDIKNDGMDYIYVVDDGRATRKNIELHEINGAQVRVTNLEDGVEIITSGTNALAEGYKVKIKGDDNE